MNERRSIIMKGDFDMNRLRLSILFLKGMLLVLPLLCLCFGCSNTNDTIGAAVGLTLLGGQSPTQEIEQIYYLGVFDPMEQTPSAIFRLTVKGQASAISRMKFASGWVPANLVDSLNTNMSFNEEGIVVASKAENAQLSQIETGRRLMVFGPEGYRETPRNHRLVLVMSSSPERYFAALSDSLGTLADVQIKKLDEHFHQKVFQSLTRIRTEQKDLESLREQFERDVIVYKGGE